MATTVELIHEIEKLPPVERARIVDRIMRNIIRPDADMDKAWLQEAFRRLEAFEKGEIATVPYEEAMSKYKLS